MPLAPVLPSPAALDRLAAFATGTIHPVPFPPPADGLGPWAAVVRVARRTVAGGRPAAQKALEAPPRT